MLKSFETKYFFNIALQKALHAKPTQRVNYAHAIKAGVFDHAVKRIVALTLVCIFCGWSENHHLRKVQVKTAALIYWARMDGPTQINTICDMIKRTESDVGDVFCC